MTARVAARVAECMAECMAACMAACVIECTTAERPTGCGPQSAPPLGSQHGPLWFRGYARPRGDEEAACEVGVPAGEPEHDAFNDRTAQGGFWVPPALQKHMVELRASKLSEDARARFTPFPFEK